MKFTIEIEEAHEPTVPEPTTSEDAINALDNAHDREDHRESFILYCIHFSDLFSYQETGYWLYHARQVPGAGWLVFEHRAAPRPTVTETAHVLSLWQKGEPLPERWFFLDRTIASKAYNEGIKRWGVEWYLDADTMRRDIVIQLALLGKVVYG